MIRYIRTIPARVCLLVMFGMVLVAANIFLAFFLSQESYIYSWDKSAFELWFYSVAEHLRQNPFQTLGTIYTSLIFSQHNLLIALFLAPWGLVFGADRIAYQFGVLNVFGLPALLLLGIVFWKFIARSGKQPYQIFFIPLVIGILEPHFWKPILFGYYDVVVVIIMCAVWLCILNKKREREIFFSILTGVLLALCVLARRWTAYWAVSFFGAVGIDWLASTMRGALPAWSMRAIIACGTTALLSLLVIAPVATLEMATTNYAGQYVAYTFGRTHLQLLGDALISYGLFAIALALYGCIVSLRFARSASIALLFMMQVLLTLVLFTYVQGVDPHHHYPLMAGFIFFESVGVWALVRKGAASPLRLGIAALVCIFALLNFSQAFIAPMRAWIPQSIFFSHAWHDPLVRHDIPSIKALMAFVEETTPRDSPIYVLASSEILNDDIIRNACRYTDSQSSLCRRALNAHHVDRRDGFPKHFFNAAAIITTSPTQYHLLPRDQKVIGALARALHEQRAVGRAYKRADTVFTLDNGVVAEVYYKQRDPLPQELAELEALLQNDSR